MFSLHDFVMKGLLNAVGKLADYQIIMNALGWMEKGVLTEDDLAIINEAIDKLHPIEEAVEEIPTEEVADESENNEVN